MKIALIDDVVHGYACGSQSATGGAERYMWLLTRALAARGWTATVGVWSTLGAGERTRIDGVEFVGLERSNTLRRVYDFLAAENPDWCHWFGGSHLLGPAVAIGKLTRTRTVFSAQFDLDVQPRKALHARSRLWPLYAAGLWASDRIFVQHGGQYAQLPPALQSRACVVPGIVPVPSGFKSHFEREPYVAWVGVLRQPKRPDLLVDIARRTPAVRFVVCGGASDHRSPVGYSASIIEQLRAIPNIDYRGHVAPREAVAVIAGASMLLSTSDGEGFPSVFLEAWAHGTPVVSLTIDPDQLIARTQLGVVSVNTERASTDISSLVASPMHRQAIAERCHRYVAQSHSEDAAVRVVHPALSNGSLPMMKPHRPAEIRQ